MNADFLLGLNTAVSGAIAVFFLRFWRQTRDRLFAFFSAAFGVMAAHQLILALAHPAAETRHWFYVLRLIAFLLIIVGVIDKNRSPARG